MTVVGVYMRSSGQPAAVGGTEVNLILAKNLRFGPAQKERSGISHFIFGGPKEEEMTRF